MERREGQRRRGADRGDDRGKLVRRLTWAFEWGDGKGKSVVAAYRANGQTPPEELFAPEALPGAAGYFEAWLELTADRQIGSAVGPISFSSIDRYAARFGFDDRDDFALLLRMIRAMDSAYLEIVNRNTES